MKRRGVKDTDPYDWEKIENNPQITSSNTCSNNFSTIIHNQMKTTDQHGTNSIDTELPIASNAANQVLTKVPDLVEVDCVSII